MTLAFATDLVEAPTFADCPSWCRKHDTPDPWADAASDTYPRLHEADLYADVVTGLGHATPTVAVSVVVSQDEYIDGFTPAEIAMVAYGNVDGVRVALGINPTVAEARALIAALTAAVDALGGAR